MKATRLFVSLLCAPLLLTGCSQDEGPSANIEPYDGIAEIEQITLLGNEPFWNIKIAGETATFSSPDDLDGTEFAVTRFAGNNGLGFSGELQGQAMQIAVTPGSCSDGMSDRDYPFAATIAWGDRSLKGCAYTDHQPFSGDEAP